MEVFILLMIVTFIAYSIRYLYKYNIRISGIAQKINYLNRQLSETKGKTSADLLKDYSPYMFFTQKQIENVLDEKFRHDLDYDQLCHKFEELQEYRARFWKLEGKLYWIIMIGSVVVLAIFFPDQS